MITELTKEQIALMPIYRDRWIDIGLSCEPVDLARATLAVNAAYRAAKIEPPKHIVVCDGPISAAITGKLNEIVSEAKAAIETVNTGNPTLATAMKLRGARFYMQNYGLPF